MINDAIREAINRNVDREELRRLVYTQGTKTLLQDGLIKVMEGITDLKEVLRLVDYDESDTLFKNSANMNYSKVDNINDATVLNSDAIANNDTSDNISTTQPQDNIIEQTTDNINNQYEHNNMVIEPNNINENNNVITNLQNLNSIDIDSDSQNTNNVVNIPSFNQVNEITSQNQINTPLENNNLFETNENGNLFDDNIFNRLRANEQQKTDYTSNLLNRIDSEINNV